jgi:hypothetical protein
MSKTKEVGKRQRLSSVLEIGTRRITITILSPDVGENHLVNFVGDGIVFDMPKKVTKPIEVSGVFAPSTFRVEGFLDNGIPSSFVLTLDVNKASKTNTNTSRSVRVSKIEADGEGGHLSAGLLKDIALDSVRDECLRMAAVRVPLFPAGEWDLHNFGAKKTESSTYWIGVTPEDAPEIGLIVWGHRAKNAREWALTTSGKKPRAWDSDETLKAVARLFAECPAIRNRAQWIATKLEEEGFVNTRGTAYTPQSVNSQIREARARKFIKTTTRKKATK